VKDGRKIMGELVAGKSQRQIPVKIVSAQKGEVDFTADASRLEFQLYRANGVPVSQEIRGAVSENQE
jgi:hypothetical protein